ncbi:Hypothetical protein CINCED_3A013969 [Cinara cedri]|uniref:Uncharacterized protein n=1 Tax=Cinara cedri TaxID=506608 RepID=A0A5E4NIU7_9HEMI|nr:Hypothetical protein CINCED_3A013969 [Cinara cedri]
MSLKDILQVFRVFICKSLTHLQIRSKTSKFAETSGALTVDDRIHSEYPQYGSITYFASKLGGIVNAFEDFKVLQFAEISGALMTDDPHHSVCLQCATPKPNNNTIMRWPKFVTALNEVLLSCLKPQQHCLHRFRKTKRLSRVISR